MLYQRCATSFRRCVTLFQRRALTLYQRCATLKIRRRILFHFQCRLNVISTLIHNVETTLIRCWNVGWDFLILCFCFHLLLLTLLATKHVLHFTIIHTVSLQTSRNITEIIVHDERKSVNALIFSWYNKLEFFLFQLFF